MTLAAQPGLSRQTWCSIARTLEGFATHSLTSLLSDARTQAIQRQDGHRYYLMNVSVSDNDQTRELRERLRTHISESR